MRGCEKEAGAPSDGTAPMAAEAQVAYTVRCEFTAADVADRWVEWLTTGNHINDVIAAGAVSGVLVRLDVEAGDDAPARIYEVRYTFPSRAAMDTYVSDHAPRLREEGLEKFPLSLGLKYSRTIGNVVASYAA